MSASGPAIFSIVIVAPTTSTPQRAVSSATRPSDPSAKARSSMVPDRKRTTHNPAPSTNSPTAALTSRPTTLAMPVAMVKQMAMAESASTSDCAWNTVGPKVPRWSIVNGIAAEHTPPVSSIPSKTTPYRRQPYSSPFIPPLVHANGDGDNSAADPPRAMAHRRNESRRFLQPARRAGARGYASAVTTQR